MTTNLPSLRTLSFYLLAALPLVGIACGDDDDDGSENNASTVAGLSDACGQYFDATQSMSNRCFYGQPLDDDFRPSARDGFVRQCAWNGSLPDAPGGVAGVLGRCAAALSATSCDDFAGIEANLECYEFRALRGARQAGVACEEDIQCASGSCSYIDLGDCGTCDRVAGERESCAGPSVVCADGLECAPVVVGEPLICVPAKREGEACVFGCGDGLVCDRGACKSLASLPKAGEACGNVCAFGSACVASTCVALPDEGQPCLADNNASFFACRYGLACDEASNTCFRPSTYEDEPGTPCGGDETNRSCKGGYCNGEVCVAYAKLGEACSEDDSAGPECDTGYDCLAGKCAEKPLRCGAGE
jgi:hypothetical protein